VKHVFCALICLLIGFLMGVLLVEWAAGCGESYVDAYGVRHQYECVFIPNTNQGK
jgi:hypothetical protein